MIEAEQWFLLQKPADSDEYLG